MGRTERRTERSCSSVRPGMGRQGIPIGCPDGTGGQPLARDPPGGQCSWERGTLGKVALPRCSRLCERDCFQLLLLRREPSAKAGEGGVALGCREMLALVAAQLRRAGGYKGCFALLFLKSLLLSPVFFFFLHNIHPRTRGMIHWLSTTQQCP